MKKLAELLSKLPLRAVYTSPLERALETAQAVAAPRGMTPIACEGLGEVRFGEWEGKTFTELSGNPEWAEFNKARSIVRPPGGELMIEVQSRMIRESEDLRGRHAHDTIAIVSHADPLRLLIAHYLGLPIDLLQRFVIDPASLTTVRFDGNIPAVVGMNWAAGSVI